jgi:demethylmenaquinone methyltransferase/2-methoxy-6-polyprenyl-1,4-benzoquinol methylase
MTEAPPAVPVRDPEKLFEQAADRAPYVREMFEDIAARYDLMNSLMTAGRHHMWRRAAAIELVRPGDRVVDVGCGTGDLTFACLEMGARSVLGVDFAAPMLAHARHKAEDQGVTRATFALGDATRLPLEDGSVDAWCSAFVVRNIPDLDAALSEARRVLRPGGRMAILEIPKLGKSLLRPAIRLHFARVVPLLGRLVSGHASAYRYLPVSVDHFLTPPELTRRLWHSGFEVRRVERFMLGTVALHVAERMP